MLARDRRVARAFQYGLFMAAGAGSFFINVSFTAGIALKTCGAFLILGGAIAMVGHTRRVQPVEVIGFYLLTPAMGALSISALVGGDQTPPRYFVGLLCAAFTFALFARWRDLRALIRLNASLRAGGQQ